PLPFTSPVPSFDDFQVSHFLVFLITLTGGVQQFRRNLVEYNQRFFPENTNHTRKCNLVLDELKAFITLFNIPITLISLYKYTKFFIPSLMEEPNLFSNIELLMETWGYKESLLVHNIKRRKWQQEPWEKLERLIDSQSYIALFNCYR
ncbi:MAG: hypothetical protein ACTSPG_09235, partial [Candidatus Hodarchaeales archaeon]